MLNRRVTALLVILFSITSEVWTNIGRQKGRYGMRVVDGQMNECDDWMDANKELNGWLWFVDGSKEIRLKF